MVELPKKYKKISTLKKVVIGLDMILAILIIITSTRLMETQLGKATLAFGFVMLAFAGVLVILDRL
jgi:chromate transport protein ChrA